MNEFLGFGDGANGSLLSRGARKIDVDVRSSVTGLSGVHIRATTVSELENDRTLSTLHVNEPPADDFMYASVISDPALERMLISAADNTDAMSPNRSERLSVTSL